MAEVDQALKPYLDIAAQTMGKGLTVGRTERLMAHLGNPERSLRVVHVAGTSGKTSTTYYIATMLHKSGVKVGHTVSPHVDSLTERVQVNGAPLSEEKFCAYMGEFLELIANAPEKPSWFECMIAFAFWVFAQEKVEYVVIETGMGGLHDSTNVATRTDKVCVITDIGLDHQAILGDTLDKIAYQKVGIVHDGNSVLMYDQSPAVMQVIRYWVSQQEDAELFTFEESRLRAAYGGQIATELPTYQQRNWLLAFAAYRYIAKRDDLMLLTQKELVQTQRVQVPARMDGRRVDGKTIVMDGAHNDQKMQAFWASFDSLYPATKPVVLLALKQGKEIHDLAPLLKQHASHVIVTTFVHSQDLPLASIEPVEIAVTLNSIGVSSEIVADQDEAYEHFIDRTEDVGVVTGSFYLIAQLRQKYPALR